MNFWKAEDSQPQPERDWYDILDEAIANLKPGERVDLACEGEWVGPFNYLYSNRGVYRDQHPDITATLKDDIITLVRAGVPAPPPPEPVPAPPEPAPEPAPIDDAVEPDVVDEDSDDDANPIG
jgi:hypothetical protein